MLMVINILSSLDMSDVSLYVFVHSGIQNNAFDCSKDFSMEFESSVRCLFGHLSAEHKRKSSSSWSVLFYALVVLSNFLLCPSIQWALTKFWYMTYKHFHVLKEKRRREKMSKNRCRVLQLFCMKVEWKRWTVRCTINVTFSYR